MAALGSLGRGLSSTQDSIASCSPRCFEGQLGPRRAQRRDRVFNPVIAVFRRDTSGIVGSAAVDDTVKANPVLQSRNGNGTTASRPPPGQSLVVAPEDFKLPPGRLSTINRTAAGSPADTYRCAGCTKDACQVHLFGWMRGAEGHTCCSMAEGRDMHALFFAWASAADDLGGRGIVAVLPVPFAAAANCFCPLHLHACLQGPFGCSGIPWRTQPGGYLREILTAKVYDVSVSEDFGGER
jgi:hypothetical protein